MRPESSQGPTSAEGALGATNYKWEDESVEPERCLSAVIVFFFIVAKLKFFDMS